jgi:hypothetical protein
VSLFLALCFVLVMQQAPLVAAVERVVNAMHAHWEVADVVEAGFLQNVLLCGVAESNGLRVIHS